MPCAQAALRASPGWQFIVCMTTLFPSDAHSRTWSAEKACQTNRSQNRNPTHLVSEHISQPLFLSPARVAMTSPCLYTAARDALQKQMYALVTPLWKSPSYFQKTTGQTLSFKNFLNCPASPKSLRAGFWLKLLAARWPHGAHYQAYVTRGCTFLPIP